MTEFNKTAVPTVQNVAEAWKRQYFHVDNRWRDTILGSSKEIYKNILKSKTLDEVDKAIGNTSWTTSQCSECCKSSRKTMIMLDINGGEYDHVICKECVTKMYNQMNVLKL